jgi:hypothetical protein
MSASTVYEVVGYVASALIVLSLAMSSIIRLRIVNLVGAVIFSIYGVLIGSIPVVLTNTIITGLDIWYLRKELRTREELFIIQTAGDDPFLQALVEVFGDDLDSFVQPDMTLGDADISMVMLRNATAAGVFAGVTDGSTLQVVADYVAPAYRDHKCGAQLYADGGGRFADLGFRVLRVPKPDSRQADYFTAMGFELGAGGEMVLTVGGRRD